MTRPVAIMSALQAEIEALLGIAEDVVERRSPPIPIWDCLIDGIDVVITTAGIGKVRAGTTMGLIHASNDPRLVVFTGVAGGLDPQLEIGDVVVGERTIQHDAGFIEEAGLVRYQAGHLPFFNPTDLLGFTPSRDLLDRVIAKAESFSPGPVLGRVPRVVTGTILTGDQFINDDQARNRLFAELTGSAVEMEGAALAQSAESLGVEHLVIRSLSDLAGAESIDDFGRYLNEVAENSARLVRHLLPVL